VVDGGAASGGAAGGDVAGGWLGELFEHPPGNQASVQSVDTVASLFTVSIRFP
jgi:hypothetical protein